METEANDTFWSLAVTDIEPTGASAAMTRVALLSSLRAIDEARSIYVDGELLVAEYPFTAESVLPVVPGQPSTSTATSTPSRPSSVPDTGCASP